MAEIIIIKDPVYHLSIVITGVEKEMILAQSKYKGVTVSRLSQIIGINRQYFYKCLEQQQFEISKFIHLQAILDLKFITKDSVHSAYNRLANIFYADLPATVV